MMKAILFLCILVCTASAQLTIKRTYSGVSGLYSYIKITPGCATSDQYGSNDCSWPYGSSFTVNQSLTLKNDITANTKLTFKANVAGAIPVGPFVCQLCGGNCTITIPIINQKFSFALPPCPIRASSESSVLPPFTLPAKNPLPVAAGVTVEVILTGDVTSTLNFTADFAAISDPELFTALMDIYVFRGLRHRN